jgi:toxin HigB-1
MGDVERLRAMLAFIASAASLDELANPPNDGLHRLTGSRADTWSMTVTRNWRLTFTLTQTGSVTDMNLEDYHGS